MKSHKLQWIQALYHPALTFTDTRDINLEEVIWYSAPQHMGQKLDMETWGTLRHWVFVFTFEQASRQWHYILEGSRQRS